MLASESPLGSITGFDPSKRNECDAVPSHRPDAFGWLRLVIVFILCVPFLLGIIIMTYAIAYVLIKWP